METFFCFCSEGRCLKIERDVDVIQITTDSLTVNLMGYPTNMMVAINAILGGEKIHAFALEGRYGNVSRMGDVYLFNISGNQFELTKDDLVSLKDALIKIYG